MQLYGLDFVTDCLLTTSLSRLTSLTFHQHESWLSAFDDVIDGFATDLTQCQTMYVLWRNHTVRRGHFSQLLDPAGLLSDVNGFANVV
jgi:hypothetical protein